MEEYDKGRVIGRGTFGNVYRAVHKASGRVVALKKVRLNGDDGVHITALREIKALSELRGNCDGRQHVVQLLGAFPHKDKLMLVFEFVGGGDVDVVLRRRGSRPLPAEQTRRCMRGLLTALAYIHARGILHRDVKCVQAHSHCNKPRVALRRHPC
jgi:serine/threonine protein kinase